MCVIERRREPGRGWCRAPALENVLSLFFGGILLSCPQGDVSVTCAFAVVGEKDFQELWSPGPAPQRSVKAALQNPPWAVIPACPVGAREPGLTSLLQPSQLAVPWARCLTSLGRLLISKLRTARAEGCGEARRCSMWMSGR